MKRILLAIGLVLLWLCPSVHAATATPVTVNSISVSAPTVTVNTATSDGLSVNQGFCLSAPTNFCGTVATTPSATQFTFNEGSATLSSCSSACGTVVPAKQVIVLSINPVGATAGQEVVNGFCWLATTQPVVRSGASSVWSGASGPENAAIAAGWIIEQGCSLTLPMTAGAPDIKNNFQKLWQTFQNQITNAEPVQQVMNGNFWDGTGWSQ